MIEIAPSEGVLVLSGEPTDEPSTPSSMVDTLALTAEASELSEQVVGSGSVTKGRKTVPGATEAIPTSPATGEGP